MARRCASAAILETLRDPRVVTMPAAAQTLWIRMITAMQNCEMSVLKLGSEIMNRTAIALFIQIAETEIETHLETLIGRGLLTRSADGALTCPMLEAAKTRADINRANGKRGGRPRKQQVPIGQGEMIMAVQGGKMESKITESETESETEPGANDAARTTYLSNKESISGKSVIDDAEYHALGREVLAAIEVDEARSFVTYGLVRQWLADGADRKLILGVIADVMGRPNKPRITTLNYFSPAIADALKNRPPPKAQWEREWEVAYNSWELTGRGVEPMPSVEEFKRRGAA